jgi:hypothetical protein
LLVTSCEHPLTVAQALDCPEGLDDALWAKVVELRQQKIESEAAIRVKMADLADLTSFLNKRLAVDEELARKVRLSLSLSISSFAFLPA